MLRRKRNPGLEELANLLQKRAIDLQGGHGGLYPGETLRPLDAAGHQRLSQDLVAEDLGDRIAQSFRLCDRDQASGVSGNLGYRRGLGGDDRRLTGHRLEDGQAEPLVEGWEDASAVALIEGD